MVVGQPFLGFQWDVLLLEAGLLGVLFAPWSRGWACESGTVAGGGLADPMAGLPADVPLGGGEADQRRPVVAAWEALKYHYETQPLPTWTSWYVHQLPAWFHAASVGFMFWAELIAPFFVFGPRTVRMVAFWSIVLSRG